MKGSPLEALKLSSHRRPRRKDRDDFDFDYEKIINPDKARHRRSSRSSRSSEIFHNAESKYPYFQLYHDSQSRHSSSDNDHDRHKQDEKRAKDASKKEADIETCIKEITETRTETKGNDKGNDKGTEETVSTETCKKDSSETTKKDVSEGCSDSSAIAEQSEQSESSEQLEPFHDPLSPEIKKVRELTTVLLDTRKTLQADANVVDPTLGEHHHFEAYRSANISRHTYSKAERVKSMISVKYLYIQRVYETSQHEVHHKNVEGVYNPIQILRNRVVRQKEDKHDMPKVLTIKLLPLACNAFSKHNLHSPMHKPWQMFWSIDLNEYFGDLAWRRTNWDRLRRPDGELWFPRKESRLHDNLFVTGSNKEMEKLGLSKLSNKSPENHSNSFKSYTIDSDSSHHKSQDEYHKRRRKIMSKMKKHTKRLYGSEDNIQSNSQSPSDIRSRSSSESYSSDHKVESEIADVHFEAIERPEDYLGNELESYTDEKVAPKPNPPVQVVEEHDESEESDLYKAFRYFDGLVRLKVQYIVSIYPQFSRTMEARLESIIHGQVAELFKTTASITDYNLPAYQQLYDGFSKEIKAAIHSTNDSYPAKIDSLLSTSDRSIGEINTSLSLELRKINEKLEKLSGSLSSSTLIHDEPASDIGMKIEQGDFSKFLYIFLENFIVVVLRLVWVIVNIYKIFAATIRFIYKAIRWIIF